MAKLNEVLVLLYLREYNLENIIDEKDFLVCLTN